MEGAVYFDARERPTCHPELVHWRNVLDVPALVGRAQADPAEPVVRHLPPGSVSHCFSRRWLKS
jgi:hypothetical protein